MDAIRVTYFVGEKCLSSEVSDSIVADPSLPIGMSYISYQNKV